MFKIKTHLPPDWRAALSPQIDTLDLDALESALEKEQREQIVYPPQELIFNALKLTPYQDVKVFILGQDPYHQPGQAMGLSFSVPEGSKIPPSLRNIYKERQSDLGIPPSAHGSLLPWAKQGVLLLNAILTVRHAEAASHQKIGWQAFSDLLIQTLNERKEPIVFLLWGNFARKKKKFITHPQHMIIESAHPSPLSASRGFLNSKPFSQINELLKEKGRSPIDWNS